MNERSGSGGGRGKNKRFWTAEEDKALIMALSELANDPHWKCENGFRNGYMNRLEQLIDNSIPGCGLKVSPHIDSRLKTIVRKFRAIVQMLGTSGFTWDDDKHMISVSRSAYDEYCMVHPNCKNLYGHAFPHLNALREIYGKDYATGKPIEGFVDAIDNMEKSTPVEGFVDAVDNMEKSTPVETVQIVDSSDDEHTSIASGSDNQSGESAPPLKKMKSGSVSELKGGKEEHESGSSSELATLQAFMKDMNVHLSTMANVMSRADEREQQVAERSEKVLDELLSLEGITPNQALKVAEILTAQPNKLLIFFKCSNTLKTIYVQSLLGGIHGGDA